MAPPTAFVVNKRFKLPPTQRMPSPKRIGWPSDADPWNTSVGAFGISPPACSKIVSGLVAPVAFKRAPPVAAELSQPRLGNPALPHGHAPSDPSPKQNFVIAVDPHPRHAAMFSDELPDYARARTARVAAERAVGTFQFAAAEARKLAGEMTL